MTNISALSKKAIKAARNQDWEQAVILNQQILDENPQDINALNRLALAYMQQNHPRKARWELEKVLEIDKHNKIANKNLKRVKNKQYSKVNFGKQNFIEEPGKAKNIELTRIPQDNTFEQISIGQECRLEPKSTFISIYTKEDSQYLGALPEKISQRLKKFIKQGNRYQCYVKALESGHCVVHIKEDHISPKNQGQPTFVGNSANSADKTDKIIDEYKVKDDIPLGIVDTDTDEEMSSKNFTDLD